MALNRRATSNQDNQEVLQATGGRAMALNRQAATASPVLSRDHNVVPVLHGSAKRGSSSKIHEALGLETAPGNPSARTRKIHHGLSP